MTYIPPLIRLSASELACRCEAFRQKHGRSPNFVDDKDFSEIDPEFFARHSQQMKFHKIAMSVLLAGAIIFVFIFIVATIKVR